MPQPIHTDAAPRAAVAAARAASPRGRARTRVTGFSRCSRSER